MSQEVPVYCVEDESINQSFAQDFVHNNSEDIVVDPANGLMWQDQPENSSLTYTWEESIDYCEALDHAGFDDWRLPSINEPIYALPNETFNYETVVVGGWSPGGDNIRPYWSSKPSATAVGNIWTNESEGYTYSGYSRENSFYARCIRDDLSRLRSPYLFDPSGAHTATVDTDTGVTLTTFEYNDDGQLSAVVDRFGNTITIELDCNGDATAIVSPDGYRTELTVDSNGDLIRAEYEDGSYCSFGYSSESLMTSERDPNDNLFTRTYDSLGRVSQTFDPEGGQWDFYSNKDLFTGITTFGYDTIEGNSYESQRSTLENGDLSIVTTELDGTVNSELRQVDDLYDSITAGGAEAEVNYVIDSKTQQEITVTLPSGLQSVTQIDKTYDENGVDTIRFRSSDLTKNCYTRSAIWRTLRSSERGVRSHPTRIY